MQWCKTRANVVVAGWAVLILAGTAWGGLPKEVRDRGTGPWPVEVKGFVPAQPGEHPRLLFRKADVERLRAKAETPEGQAAIKRLRAQLSGSDGQSMPTVFEAPKGAESWPPGGFSLSHVAGFGLLYQLTGDKKYAELGKQCFEKSLEGAPTCDGRYRFKRATGALRAGPTLGWHALGYDLCYDGWDEAYRLKIAKVISNYNEGRWCSIEELARGERQHPGSNHWGMQIGGSALALLAVMNDPGVDMARIGRLLEQNEEAMKINMTQGFGSGGFRGDFQPGKDGSTILTTGDGSCLAIDLSGASGADALLVMTGPGAAGDNAVEAGGTSFSFLFLGGSEPKPKVADGKVVVGGQTVRFDGKNIVLGQ